MVLIISGLVYIIRALIYLTFWILKLIIHLNVSFIGFTEFKRKYNEKYSFIYVFDACFCAGSGAERFSGNGCL